MDSTSIFRIDGKVAVITGASSGLGAHIAQVLAGAGAEVVLAARRKEKLDSVIAGIGASASGFQCDVTNDSDLEALVDFVVKKFGKIDICVNNAGTSDPEPAESESPEKFRSIMAVNLESVFVLSQLVGRVMLEAGEGSIVNVSSIAGLLASGQIPQASYAASKAAVINLTRELAAQWARRGVRVNAIAPGWFPSEMTQEMFGNPRGQDFIRKRCPMGRTGELAELDGALLLLSSKAGSYITGETVVIDGGWSII
ncbi:MAG: glucose 1-dehydrogenase [Acidimicrobiaceae bacterium]|nr:glucose 1-dehydrogenase [Acidimicrobiaceae bacterium]